MRKKQPFFIVFFVDGSKLLELIILEHFLDTIILKTTYLFHDLATIGEVQKDLLASILQSIIVQIFIETINH